MNEMGLRPAPAWVRLAATFIRHLPAGRYHVAHRICRRPPAKFLMRMPAEMGGYPFQCDLRDTISREVCFTGHYEPQETVLVRSILRPGMSFVDVGANWGYFTLLAASLVGKQGRVLSLEPDPRLFTVLKENIIRSELNQVTALQAAAASQAGALTLAGFDEHGENFGLSRIVANSSAGEKQTFQVRADSLDNILDEQELDSIDLMKMDIEGAEAFAIEGLARSFAERRVKRLLLELHPVELAEHGSSATAIIERLHRAGYEGWTIDHSPDATRRAAYKRATNIGSLLRSLNLSDQLDAWPHQLWLAPGIG